MKYLLLITLLLFSHSVLTPEPRYEVGVGKGIGEDVRSPVEQPMKPQGGVDEEELHCMTLALYKETRGEPERGSMLVAQVIMNRAGENKSVCSVVKKKLAGNCMFSFWCSPNREKITDIRSYKRLTQIAYNAILGEYSQMTKTTYFKRCDFKSKFFDKLTYKGHEGNHCFYL